MRVKLFNVGAKFTIKVNGEKRRIINQDFDGVDYIIYFDNGNMIFQSVLIEYINNGEILINQ